MRNNRNHEVASERECFTHYELIDNLARHQEGHGTSRIEIKTMTGQEYTFECRGKTTEDFLEFMALLDSPMDVVSEHCANLERNYSHSIYTRQTNWMYLIQIYFKDGVVI